MCVKGSVQISVSYTTDATHLTDKFFTVRPLLARIIDGKHQRTDLRCLFIKIFVMSARVDSVRKEESDEEKIVVVACLLANEG